MNAQAEVDVCIAGNPALNGVCGDPGCLCADPLVAPCDVCGGTAYIVADNRPYCGAHTPDPQDDD